MIDECIIDGEREDQFQLLLHSDSGLVYPSSLVLSTVHRKSAVESLQVLYNAHFLYAALWPSSVLAHPYVSLLEAQRDGSIAAWKDRCAARERERKKKRKEEGEEENEEHKEDEEEDQADRPITNVFNVLALTPSLSSIRTLALSFEELDNEEEVDEDGNPIVRREFQHPSEQFFGLLPERFREGSKFHRAGYMWSADDGWTQQPDDGKQGGNTNRQTGTYLYKHRQNKCNMTYMCR